MLHARTRATCAQRPCPPSPAAFGPACSRARAAKVSFPMASNLSVSDSTPTPDITSSERIAWVLIWYLVILPAVWLTPVVYSWLRWLRRRHGKTVQTEAASASVISSSEAAMLEAAEQSRRRLHARVNNTLWQAGWVLIWLSQMPFVPYALVGMGATPAMDITEIVGNHRYHLALVPWAAGLFLASIDPTEAKRIFSVVRLICSIQFFMYWITIPQYRVLLRMGYHTLAYALFACVQGNLMMSIACAHTLWWHKCIGGEQMPPRRMLRRFVLIWRCYFLYVGVWWTIVYSARISCIKDGSYLDTCENPPYYAVGAASWSLFAIVFTKSNHGRLRRWVGSLGKDGSAEQKAASVASLLGGTSVAAALTTAAARFRAKPLSTLTLESLLHNKPDPTLYATTVPAKLGEVHAFMSHSWSDDGNAKYNKLHEWARELGGGDDKLVWLDKACIDQDNIDASLAALPIYLSGCRQLLMLVGPTYITRMWCVMEVFIFMRMKDGGTTGAAQHASQLLVVKLLDDNADLKLSLARFDAAKAQCYYDRDRQKLLAVIEASFGTAAPFNQLVLRVLNAQILGLSHNPKAMSHRTGRAASGEADVVVV